MISLKEKLHALPQDAFRLDRISIRPVQDDWDLWYATVECRLFPGRKNL